MRGGAEPPCSSPSSRCLLFLLLPLSRLSLSALSLSRVGGQPWEHLEEQHRSSRPWHHHRSSPLPGITFFRRRSRPCPGSGQFCCPTARPSPSFGLLLHSHLIPSLSSLCSAAAFCLCVVRENRQGSSAMDFPHLCPSASRTSSAPAASPNPATSTLQRRRFLPPAARSPVSRTRRRAPRPR